MHLTVVVIGLVVALAAAARSTWSPCGLSMLSSITPLGEAGRGHRFGPTAAWFLAGGVAGGLTLGAALAVVGDLAAAAGVDPRAGAAVAAAACGLAALADAGLLGVRVPLLRRQVNEVWLDQYRSWVYGAGFGWQIGVGFSTYVMTTAVLALVPLAAATASPAAGLAMGVVFGTFRGATVLLGRRVTSPGALRAVHARLDGFARPVWFALIVLLGLACAALGAWSWPPLIGAVALVGAAGASARVARRRPAGRSCEPDRHPLSVDHAARSSAGV
jgi:hypothetical protein